MWRNCAGKLRARVKAVKHQDIKTLTYFISISVNLSRKWFCPDQHFSPSTTTTAMSTTIQTAKIEKKHTLCWEPFRGTFVPPPLSLLFNRWTSTKSTTTTSTRIWTTAERRTPCARNCPDGLWSPFLRFQRSVLSLKQVLAAKPPDDDDDNGDDSDDDDDFSDGEFIQYRWKQSQECCS